MAHAVDDSGRDEMPQTEGETLVVDGFTLARSHGK
jgi:hypothetical protein